MIEKNSDLFGRLSTLVVSGLPLQNETLNEVMAFVLDKDKKHQESVGKWIDNCDKLTRKLNENKNQ